MNQNYYDSSPIDVASAPNAIKVAQLDSSDDIGGVITSKPIYNYDSVKNRNLAEQVSDAAFITY